MNIIWYSTCSSKILLSFIINDLHIQHIFLVIHIDTVASTCESLIYVKLSKTMIENDHWIYKNKQNMEIGTIYSSGSSTEIKLVSIQSN